MRSKPTAITSLPPSPDAERRSRMIRYSIAMGIRLLCVPFLLILHGWWLLIPVAGAVVLPYIAVVVANSVNQRSGRVEVPRPGGLARLPAAVPPPRGPHEDPA